MEKTRARPKVMPKDANESTWVHWVSRVDRLEKLFADFSKDIDLASAKKIGKLISTIKRLAANSATKKQFDAELEFRKGESKRIDNLKSRVEDWERNPHPWMESRINEQVGALESRLNNKIDDLAKRLPDAAMITLTIKNLNEAMVQERVINEHLRQERDSWRERALEAERRKSFAIPLPESIRFQCPASKLDTGGNPQGWVNHEPGMNSPSKNATRGVANRNPRV